MSEIVREGYEVIARTFNEWRDRIVGDPRDEWRDLLASKLADGARVLELGCGSGTLTRHLVEAGHRVVATDASSRPTPRRTCSSWPGRLSQAPRSFAS